MFKKIEISVVLAGLFVMGIYGAQSWVAHIRRAAEDRALAPTAQWSAGPRLAALAMVEKYGPPEWATGERLEWGARWPWSRIVVLNKPSAPLEQTVAYRIAPDRVQELQGFGHGLAADFEFEELTAGGGDERLNFLCLNLANDIATGRRSAGEAARFFRRTTKLAAAGKSSAYLEGLLFYVPSTQQDMPLPLP